MITLNGLLTKNESLVGVDIASPLVIANTLKVAQSQREAWNKVDN